MSGASDWLLWGAIVGLGGWRLASLLVHEEGPFGVFARMRAWTLPEPGEEYGFLAKVLDCIWCASIYTTTALAVLWLVSPVLVAVPAAWGAAILAEAAVRRP